MLLKRAGHLFNVYRQESARDSKTAKDASTSHLGRVRTERFIYPFDTVEFHIKGKAHTSQFVLILSIWTWMNGLNPLENSGRKLSVNDVELQLR